MLISKAKDLNFALDTKTLSQTLKAFSKSNKDYNHTLDIDIDKVYNTVLSLDITIAKTQFIKDISYIINSQFFKRLKNIKQSLKDYNNINNKTNVKKTLLFFIYNTNSTSHILENKNSFYNYKKIDKQIY